MKPDACILVVDDEPILREIFAEWLEAEPYRVLTAEHGREALRLLAIHSVNAVVTDIRMPVMDGITLLKELCASATAPPAVIFVTGFSDITPREAYDLGAETILSKPFQQEQLLQAVRRVLTPARELWRSPAPVAECQNLEASFLGVQAARDAGRIAFGRGGVSLWPVANLRGGPVRFELRFSKEGLRLSGHGTVRWVRAAEETVGVEITRLDDDCLEQGLALTAGSGARCYIPATTL